MSGCEPNETHQMVTKHSVSLNVWTPKGIHNWLVNVFSPVGGIFLTFYLPITNQFELWQVSLILGLLAIPLGVPDKYE